MAVQMTYCSVAMTTHSNYFDTDRPSPPPSETAPWFSGKMDRVQAEQFLMEVCWDDDGLVVPQQYINNAMLVDETLIDE